MSLTENKTVLHIAAETVVFGGLTLYLLNRISSLEQEVAKLRADVQIVAKHGSNVTEAVNEVGRRVLAMNTQPAIKSAIETTPPVVSALVTPVVQQEKKAAKKLQFTDDESEDEAFQAPQAEQHVAERMEEVEESDEEDEPPARPVIKPRSKSKRSQSGVKVVSSPAPPVAKKGGKDMDELKRKAAAAYAAATGGSED